MGKNLEEKQQIILDYEHVFVERLAIKIYKKPQLSIWMILIPIIFIYFFQQLAKYKNEKRFFVKNYLLSPNRALNEAYEAIKQKREFDIEPLVQIADLKSYSIDPYRDLMSILAHHYTNLLNAKGNLYGDLILSAYPEKHLYLQMMDSIADGWKTLNQTIVKELAETTPGAAETVKEIEIFSMEIRNKDTNVFY